MLRAMDGFVSLFGSSNIYIKVLRNLTLNILDIVLDKHHVEADDKEAIINIIKKLKDDLGKNYIIDAGYDETGSYRFLSRLRDLSQLSSDKDKKNINSLFATHPKTKDRMENVKNSINNKNLFVTNRNEYLAMINNTV